MPDTFTTSISSFPDSFTIGLSTFADSYTVNIQEARDGIDGTNGIDGSNGTDGISPIIHDAGTGLEVSADNGATFSPLVSYQSIIDAATINPSAIVDASSVFVTLTGDQSISGSKTFENLSVNDTQEPTETPRDIFSVHGVNGDFFSVQDNGITKVSNLGDMGFNWYLLGNIDTTDCSFSRLMSDYVYGSNLYCDNINPWDSGNITVNGDMTLFGFLSSSGLITGNNLVYNTGDQSIAGTKTFTNNIVANGTANRLPNQSSAALDAIMTRQMVENSYGYFPSVSSTRTVAINGGRTLNYFEGSLNVTAALTGVTTPFALIPPGNSRGRFQATYATNTNSSHQFLTLDCPFYAYGTVYTGIATNVELRRSPDVGSFWCAVTVTGSPSSVATTSLTGSRGSIVRCSQTAPVTTSIQFNDVRKRLPSTGEIFTLSGGSITIANNGILGSISDAQANYTMAILSNLGVFVPSTMPLGTLYINGYYIT